MYRDDNECHDYLIGNYLISDLVTLEESQTQQETDEDPCVPYSTAQGYFDELSVVGDTTDYIWAANLLHSGEQPIHDDNEEVAELQSVGVAKIDSVFNDSNESNDHKMFPDAACTGCFGNGIDIDVTHTSPDISDFDAVNIDTENIIFRRIDNQTIPTMDDIHRYISI